jgi:eukaryotic-like serine/threonine-protein kinase
VAGTDDERPTAAIRPLEKPDSVRATVAMPPLFKDAEDGVPERTVGDYIIEREIGRGAMGAVYVANHPKTGERVAIKVLSSQAADDEGGARLLREARAQCELAHPNIVDVISAGHLTNGRPYIVMELLEGESARGRLNPYPSG